MVNPERDTEDVIIREDPALHSGEGSSVTGLETVDSGFVKVFKTLAMCYRAVIFNIDLRLYSFSFIIIFKECYV